MAPRHRRPAHRAASVAAWVLGTVAVLLTVHGVAAGVDAWADWSQIAEVEQRLTMMGLGHYTVGALLAWSLTALALVVRGRRHEQGPTPGSTPGSPARLR